MPNKKPSRTIDYLLGWSLRHPLPTLIRYLVVIALIAFIALVRALFVTELLPWLLFIPVILLCGLMFGRNEGMFASVTAAIAAGLSIGNSNNPLWMSQAQWSGSVLFLLVTLGLAIVASELRSAYARAARLGAENVAAGAALAQREAFLSSVLSSSTDCIKVLDLDGRLTFMSDGGMKVMEVSDFNAIAGCPWPDFWLDQGNKTAKEAIEAARAGKASGFVGEAKTMAGTPKWWDVAVSPIAGANGKPERILSVSRDITASRAQEEHNRQLSRIIETSTDFIGMADLDGRVFFLNDAGRSLVGLEREEVGTVHISDFFSDDEASLVTQEILPQVVSSGYWSGERQFRHFQSGDLIPMLCTVFPVLSNDGALMGFGTVSRDFRERKAAEAQLVLLNQELGHRLKNVLAIVQSVASQTLRQADDLRSANSALASRLNALGEATTILTSSSWESADLKLLLKSLLRHHVDVNSRIVVNGPEITLFPQGTLAFALAVHELATNAVKYGALSSETGGIEITWDVIKSSQTPEQNDGMHRFEFLWKEHGGPTVAVPSRQGFGSKMIERLLRSYFKGEAQLKYRAEGLMFRLDCPLDAVGKLKE